MSEVKITLPDNSFRSYPTAVTGMMIAQSISEGLARNSLAVEVNGEIWDLSRPILEDSSVKSQSSLSLLNVGQGFIISIGLTEIGRAHV